MAAKAPGPPARCLPMGACTAPAPACLDSIPDLFHCDSASGAWVSNYTEFPVNLVIGGPVLILGNMTVTLNHANLTFNESRSAYMTVRGHANLTLMHNTWSIDVGEDDIDALVQVEKSGSVDFSASKREVFVAQTVELPSGWKMRVVPRPSCHVVNLVSTSPTWDNTTFANEDGTPVPGLSFDLFFYTKSACWWWIILVGTILVYLALLIVVIVAFRCIPALKAWTAPPINEAFSKQAFTTNAYQLDDISAHISHSDSIHETDESHDSVKLDI